MLTAAETRDLEATVAPEIGSRGLMERAGALAAEAVAAFTGPAETLVLCGPGNNGGDGYVVARLLREAGWPVRVGALAPPATPDAAAMRERWAGPVAALADARPAPLMIDALFGTGLTRPLEEPALRALHRLGTAAGVRVAVDLPSGVESDTGAALSEPVACELTVTFATLKPAHRLHPGAAACGRVVVGDIGLTAPSARLWENAAPVLAPPGAQAHKYARGAVLVLSGPAGRSGASRLAARAALRVGAGLVTLAAPGAALAEHAAQLDAIMLRELAQPEALPELAAEQRATALALGPGLGTGARERRLVLAALRTGLPVVLDGDVFTLFADEPRVLFDAMPERAILTPHEGEFARLFGEVGGSKVERARAAARAAGAVVVLKGADSAIAAPDGHAAINLAPTAWLATAGSGDVLTGVAAGLLGGGMDAWRAACGAVWLHAQAGALGGPGLTADDLPRLVAASLARCR